MSKAFTAKESRVFTALRACLFDERTSKNDCAVYACLLGHVRGHTSRPSRVRIAQETGINAINVSRHTRKLSDLGYLKVMPQGLQVFNADGSLQFDLTNRLMRTLVGITTGTSNGSLGVPALVQGTALIAMDVSGTNADPPTVTVAGTTVSWDFGSSTTKQSVNLRVMVF